MNHRDSQTLGGPSDVKPDDIAFANQIDSRHRAADSSARYRHERKLERDLLAAMGPHYAATARAVELQNHPLVEISWKALTVIFVLVRHNPKELAYLGRADKRQARASRSPHCTKEQYLTVAARSHNSGCVLIPAGVAETKFQREARCLIFDRIEKSYDICKIRSSQPHNRGRLPRSVGGRARFRPANHRRDRVARRHHYDRRPLHPAAAAKISRPD